MAIEIRQLHPVFGAEIAGVDVGRPLDAATVQAIRDAVNRYGILLFRDQSLDDERHVRFARSFGEPEISINAIRKGNRSTAISPVVSDITNLDESGTPRGRDDRRRLFSLGNRIWHSDSSFREIPAALSIFHAREVPPRDGETEFADMRAAHDALPDATKARIRDMIAVHDQTHLRAQLGFTDFSPEELAAWPPVRQRVVRRHPESRRLSLFIGGHASHIEGLPIPEGRMLLLDLLEFATRPEFVYRQSWRPRDLVIWDNRCTLHRGRDYDMTCKRDFRRVTTSDIASTLEQAA